MAKILVVEDYDSLRAIYQTSLTNAGHDVRAAADGYEALRIVEAQEPDLILLDLLLPSMGGLEFLKTYDLKKHPKVKVVIFSNLFSANLLDEARRLGAKHYLTKVKFTPKEMTSFVNKTLAEK